MEPNAPARDRREASRPTKSEQARFKPRGQATAREARTGPRAKELGESPRHLRYGGRAPEEPRKDDMGLSVGTSGEWLPNFDGQFELIEEDEFEVTPHPKVREDEDPEKGPG